MTNFNAGRDIMTGEVVRLLTSTGGSVEDRTRMMETVGSMFSPPQFAGVFNVFKDFVGERFGAIRQEYAGNDPKRQKRFDEELLTPNGRKVFESITKKEADGQREATANLDATPEQYEKLPSGAAYTIPGNPKIMYKQ